MENSSPSNELNNQKSHPDSIKTPKKQNKTLILKNLNHEKFAQELVKPETKSAAEAYSKVYQQDNPNVSRANASRLVRNENVRFRVLELLEQRKNTSLVGLTDKLDKHIASQKEDISLKAVELGYKLHGALQLDGTTSNEPADININIITKASNTNELRSPDA